MLFWNAFTVLEKISYSPDVKKSERRMQNSRSLELDFYQFLYLPSDIENLKVISIVIDINAGVFRAEILHFPVFMVLLYIFSFTLPSKMRQREIYIYNCCNVWTIKYFKITRTREKLFLGGIIIHSNKRSFKTSKLSFYLIIRAIWGK